MIVTPVICVTGLARPHFLGHGLVRLYRTLDVEHRDIAEPSIFKWGDLGGIFEAMNYSQADHAILVGHSYGVSSLVYCAEQMVGTDMTFDLVSADGVWRPCPSHPSLESLDRTHLIRTPDNIKRVFAFRQEIGYIRGHRFDVPPGTLLEDKVVQGINHPGMEKIPQIEETVMQLLTTEEGT